MQPEQIKMNIAHSIVAHKAIDKVLNDEKGQPRKLPFRVKYRLTSIKNALATDVDTYERERVALVQSLGEKTTDENGHEIFQVKDPEKLTELSKALETIALTETTAQFNKLDESDVEALEDVEVEMSDGEMGVFSVFLIEQDLPLTSTNPSMAGGE